MSDQSLKDILKRAIDDQQFRENLFNNPDKIIKEYNVPAELQAHLRGLDTASLMALAQRFAGGGGNGGDSPDGSWLPGF